MLFSGEISPFASGMKNSLFRGENEKRNQSGRRKKLKLLTMQKINKEWRIVTSWFTFVLRIKVAQKVCFLLLLFLWKKKANQRS